MNFFPCDRGFIQINKQDKDRHKKLESFLEIVYTYTIFSYKQAESLQVQK